MLGRNIAELPFNICSKQFFILSILRLACFDLPESPDLSLLVQNKGKGPLNVNISAPDFVWLEKTQIQLQEKEDVKVH